MKIRGHDPVHYLPHHGVRRHRLELGCLGADLALVEATEIDFFNFPLTYLLTIFTWRRGRR